MQSFISSLGSTQHHLMMPQLKDPTTHFIYVKSTSLTDAVYYVIFVCNVAMI